MTRLITQANQLFEKPRWAGFPREHVDAVAPIIAGFQLEWETGSQPDLRQWLQRNPHASLVNVLLQELLEHDILIRRQRGLPCDLNEYSTLLADYEDTLRKLWENISQARQADSLSTQPAAVVFVQTGLATLVASDEDVREQPTAIGRYQVEKLLGRGGFGVVYLAKDGLLQRQVAIKVPHARLIPNQSDVELYLHEARTVASLNHPNIVPVYDVGSVAGFPLFIVSRYIPGTDLATRIKQKTITIDQSIEIVATVAGALHYAHQHGLVHRDIKPANILIDDDAKPYVVDFGLALRDADLGYGPRLAGTPAYMSPEQARGEGHRVDGRSDVFSLGSVLYQLLTDRLPFLGDSMDALLEQISHCEARPLRQIDHTLPKELERICLKALSKRLSERYTNAYDMAEDLQLFLQTEQASKWLASKPGKNSNSTAQSASVSNIQHVNLSEQQQVPGTDATSTPHPSDAGLHVVPKGLRSFDEYDAEFFTELLPGPRGRDGLPESIRFWKTRLEQFNSDKTFAIGLLYGPSGCGKSSLMKAGVLPRLSEAVKSVYVEAAYGITESRLRDSVKRALYDKNVESKPEHISLADLLAGCRRGHYLPDKQKLVIVIDQFEQWLVDWKSNAESELVRSLRQCDGVRVQCVIMVRDDFWLATTRFMQALEVPLIEHHNAELVDLFDLAHARKVLRYIGMAYECLPTEERDFSTDHRDFLRNAAEELSEEGKVICVRLAMLAEMLKSKAWTPKTLREMGGVEGVGVAFLEDAFSSRHAPREHALHQEAARRLLGELLPESTSDIKGSMRTFEELIRAVGYEHREQDFLRLLAILDGKLRLITPVEMPEMAEAADNRSKSEDTNPLDGEALRSNQRQRLAYQLTHDFLVHAVRAWIEQKQCETWRGRTELKLIERTSIWNATQEKRQLPNIWEWFQINWLTRPAAWTDRQAAMMTSARNYHLQRITLSLTAFSLIASLIYLVIAQTVHETRLASQAARLVQNVMTAPVEELIDHVQAAERESRYTTPLLRSELQASVDSNRQTRASLALLPGDPAQFDFLYHQLLQAEPEYLPALRRGLAGYREQVVDKLHNEYVAVASQVKPLNLLAALSLFDADNSQWNSEWISRVLELLQECDRNELGAWLNTFENNQANLLKCIRDNGTTSSKVKSAILCRYAQQDSDLLYTKLWDLDLRDLAPVAQLLKRSAPQYTQQLMQELKLRVPVARDLSRKYDFDTEEGTHRQTKRRTNAAGILMLWDDFDAVWNEAARPEDPRLASELIDGLPTLGLRPQKLIDQLNVQTDVRRLQLIVLGLGKYSFGSLSRAERDTVVSLLAKIYSTSADSGLRSSASWTLRQWGQTEFLRQQLPATSAAVDLNRNWLIDSSGMPMAIVPGPTRAVIGAGPLEWGRQLNGESNQLRVQIDHDFAIGLHEVTLSQFKQCYEEYRQYFRSELSVGIGWSNRSMESPATSLNYWDAALYCRWLGEKAGLPESEQCYPPPDQIKPGMQLPGDFQKRKGYRLPTRAEWEVACRAGTTSPLNFGSRFSPYANYTWSVSNSNDQNHPVGQLMPNRLGLFDMHGNSFEWCANVYTPVMVLDVDDTLVDGIGPLEFTDSVEGILKGGEFPSQLNMHHSAFQHKVPLKTSWPASSLRVVRTLRSPALSCAIARHLGNAVQYTIAGVEAFEVVSVRGPIRVQRREGQQLDVMADSDAEPACRYAFELRPVGTKESVSVSGELLTCNLRTRMFNFDSTTDISDKLRTNFFETLPGLQPISDERIGLHQLKSQFAIGTKDNRSVATWCEGNLTVAGGRYECWINTHDLVQLTIDDQLVLNTIPELSVRSTLETIDLSPGDHKISLTHVKLAQPGDFNLSIVPAFNGHFVGPSPSTDPK